MGWSDLWLRCLLRNYVAQALFEREVVVYRGRRHMLLQRLIEHGIHEDGLNRQLQSD